VSSPPTETVSGDPAESASYLVGRIRGGDPAADEELVTRYRRGVAIILRAESRDAGAVDDLFQETFRIALEKIRGGHVRDPRKLSGFVCSLARNLVIDHFRRVAARRTSGDVALAELASPRPDALEALLSTERGVAVNRVLAEMPSDRDRQILFRFYVAEDEKDAICRDLDLTSLQFNRVLFRARERYRELFRERADREKIPGGPG
jgi:RNA polymerase sigma-70 factor (ECF subfamily)